MIETRTQDEFVIHVPKSFKNYNVIRILGCGSTCVVALVEDQITKEKYSAKIISKKNAIQRKIIDDINTEIKILKQLDHPNIIKIHESFEIQNDYKEELIVIILEYCEKGTLLDYALDSKIENQKTIKRIIFNLAHVIKYLHNKGIAHGDIKPENILLDSNLNIKLCDFGYCHTKIIQDDPKYKRGTLYYAAPELFKYGIFNTLKVDIYAFGILIYAVNEQQFPFKDGSNNSIISQIKKGKLNIREGIEEKLKKLIIKCTDFNPKNRPIIDDIISDEYFSEDQEANVEQNFISITKSNSKNEFELDEKIIQEENSYNDIIDKYEIQIYGKLMKNKYKKMKSINKHKKTDRRKYNKNKFKNEYKFQELEITYC